MYGMAQYVHLLLQPSAIFKYAVALPVVKTLSSYLRAQELILEHMDKLHAVAGKLLEKETITAEEFEKIFDN